MRLAQSYQLGVKVDIGRHIDMGKINVQNNPKMRALLSFVTMKCVIN